MNRFATLPSRLLALAAALLLLGTFSIAQNAWALGEGDCPSGQYWCDPDPITINGQQYDPEGVCCPNGTICSYSVVPQPGGGFRVNATCNVPE